MPRGISKKTQEIRDFILVALNEAPENMLRITQDEYGLTRQSVHRHLKALVDAGDIIAHGKTKSRKYTLATMFSRYVTVDITPESAEDKIWREEVRPFLEDIKKSVFEICHYGFTEMMNNVIDHSGSDTVRIGIHRTAVTVRISVEDKGIGIFEKIQQDFGLDDQRQALLELSKGKLTSDAKNHSGEGIFFTSRMFDKFYIRSERMQYYCHSDDEDYFFESQDKNFIQGTSIYMNIATYSLRDSEAVFNKFTTSDDDHAFSKTHVPVFLASYDDDQLVSRSAAKRVLSRFNKFKEVWLDFQGVDKIGQAFADEIFRVYVTANPNISLRCTNANENVHKMIKRATSKIEMGT